MSWVSGVRSFLFGLVMGAFCVCWWLDVLPEPIDRFLNEQVEYLAEQAGLEIDLTSEDESEEDGASAPAPQEPVATPDGATPDVSSSQSGLEAGSVRRTGVFDGARLTEVSTCPGMAISNAPSADSDGKLDPFSSLIDVNGVFLSRAPVSLGCLSSGYGDRGGKLHKGVDYHAEVASDIHAAADGIIREMESRNDYGNMLVIDHGNGVFTRYAHLASFADGLKIGDEVSARTVLGPMGMTATSIQHLHFEILTGDYEMGAKSFGLTSIDPMGDLS